MNARRFFTGLGVFAVAGVAGAISYSHQQHLAATHGQPYALSLVWPLCVDGLVASTGIAIATDRAAGHRPRLWALSGFWIGVVVSVVTNWLATSGGIVNHGVSAFPALAFLLAVESLSSKPRPAKPAPAAVPVTEAVFVTPTSPAVSLAADATSAPGAASRRAGKSTRRPPSADVVAKVAARMPGATTAAIAARAGVSEATVRRYRPPVTPPPAADATVASASAPGPAQTRPINGSALASVNA